MSSVRHQLNDDVGARGVREERGRFLYRWLFGKLPLKAANLRDDVAHDEAGVVIRNVE